MKDNIHPKRCTHKYCDDCGANNKRKTLRKSVRVVRHRVKQMLRRDPDKF